MTQTISYPHGIGRRYKLLRPASIDNYIWVEFQDEPGIEKMIFDSDNLIEPA